jgi:hypothetical protein
LLYSRVTHRFVEEAAATSTVVPPSLLHLPVPDAAPPKEAVSADNGTMRDIRRSSRSHAASPSSVVRVSRAWARARRYWRALRQRGTEEGDGDIVVPTSGSDGSGRRRRHRVRARGTERDQDLMRERGGMTFLSK